MNKLHSDMTTDDENSLDESSMEKVRFHNFQQNGKRSSIAKYQQVCIGKKSLWQLFKYELLTQLLTNMRGMPGFYLRQKLFPFLPLRMGRRVLIGAGVSLRQPRKIILDDGCVIDELSRLSVQGGEHAQIRLGRNVFLGYESILNARGGSIELADFANIGSHCRIATNARIVIGKYCLIGAFTYIGGGNHGATRTDIPMALQKSESHRGILIGDDVWIGGHCTILDGVTIGKGSIIGAMSLVNKDIPEYSIAYGSPAKVQRKRNMGGN